MADFCEECTKKLFGEGLPNDFVGLAGEGKLAQVLCEGCGGYILVDNEGKRVE